MKFPDYKHIITEKIFDTSYYKEGMPYHIYLPDNIQYNKQFKHLKGKDFYAICTESSEYYLGFVVVQSTGIRANYTDTYLHFTLDHIDNYDIKILACFDEEAVRDVAKDVKSNPEKYTDIDDYGTLKDLQKIEKEQVEKETTYEDKEKIRKYAYEKLEQEKSEKSFNTTRKADTIIGKWENESFTEKVNVKDEDMNDYNP
jgi:hypothetical protein